MLHNETHKYESNFLRVDIPENNSVLFKSLAGSRLGIWVAHGDGKFFFPYDESKYEIAAKYSFSTFPGNPNGSMYDAASVVSKDGRHLAIMRISNVLSFHGSGHIIHPVAKTIRSVHGLKPS